jgi:RNase P subunit RPR2
MSRTNINENDKNGKNELTKIKSGFDLITLVDEDKRRVKRAKNNGIQAKKRFQSKKKHLICSVCTALIINNKQHKAESKAKLKVARLILKNILI